MTSFSKPHVGIYGEKREPWNSPMKQKSLTELRGEIAKLDALMLRTLHKRKICCEKIAERKRSSREPLRAPNVEEEVYRRNKRVGKDLGLDEAFVLRFTKFVIAHSLKWQRKCLSRKSLG